MRTVFLIASVFALECSPCAQGLQMRTTLVDQQWNYARDSVSGYRYLPLGPVSFPLSVYAGTPFPSASVSLTQPSPLEVGISVSANNGSRTGPSAACQAYTLISMPLPARVPVTAIHTAYFNPGVGYAAEAALVDFGADGIVELSGPGGLQPQTANGFLLVDARGTNVQMQLSCGAGGQGAFASGTLTLQIQAPMQEQSFGPACAGELGCQRVANAPYARTFVASLPGSCTLAWLFGDDTQLNIPIPGVACPLLTDLTVVQAVTPVNGSDGRKFAVLDVTMPALPGFTWFAQGVAFDGSGFVGTNGVIVSL